jgi:ribosome-associated toxin RatA of RatAB toxin-antitoxin module
MTTIERKAKVPFSAQQMFDLVNNIEQYPDFLPWCGGTTVLYRTPSEVKASIIIAKGPIKKAFTTLNYLQPHHQIEMSLVEGPFKSLSGKWLFKPLDPGCEVSLALSFEFNNHWVALTLGPLFQHIANTFVSSFTERAQQVYVIA